MRKITVAVIGFGTIGAGVVKILLEKRQFLSKKLGWDIELTYICDRDFSRDRGIGEVPRDICVTDWKTVVNSDKVDIIVELVGGTSIAKDIVLSALRADKVVVTANKALLSEFAKEIFSLGSAGRNLFFEASICGAIPVVKVVREALIANRILALYGIVNGTCNYILSKMFDEALEFELVLKQAQDLGYAEQDPSLDIKGIDSAHKLSLLSLLAFGKYVHPGQINTEGITKLELIDLIYAAQMGYRVKLLAIATVQNSALDIRVHPALVPEAHMLANVSGVFNALYLKCDEAGDMMFYGRGAGRFPTASAVVSDIVDAAKMIMTGNNLDINNINIDFNPLIAPVQSRYYVRFTVVDKPGVLAKISGILGSYGISIASVQQTERAKGNNNVVPLLLITHDAKEKDMDLALSEISKLEVNKSVPVIMRIVDL